MIAYQSLPNIQDQELLLSLICMLIKENNRLQSVILGLQKRSKKRRVFFPSKTLTRVKQFIDDAKSDLTNESSFSPQFCHEKSFKSQDSFRYYS